MYQNFVMDPDYEEEFQLSKKIEFLSMRSALHNKATKFKLVSLSITVLQRCYADLSEVRNTATRFQRLQT